MTWFDELFGFGESAAAVAANITIDGERLTSAANGRTFVCGRLTTPSLAELRATAAHQARSDTGVSTVREVVADAAALHADPASAGALFQVASQFNLLEMIGPEVGPAQGITRYASDHTQGPACAMACAAGTLLRNWFAQSADDQIDTLAGVGAAIGNDPDREGRGRFWTMRNGYALLTGERPSSLPECHPDFAIGLHLDTEVTHRDAGHLVSQAYCSALPVSYSSVSVDQVEPLARLVLNSAYAATLAAAVINAGRPGGSRTVFLTLLGGGAFGNPLPWIVDAIERAVRLHAGAGLDIAIVSHRSPTPAIAHLLT